MPCPIAICTDCPLSVFCLAQPKEGPGAQDPQPHISVAWWAGDVDKELKNWIWANSDVEGQSGLEVYSEVQF